MKRLVSLDFFRGLTIALMVLVNTPGSGDHVYAPLQHAEWHGWTPTDVVFPSFAWIIGVAITLSKPKPVGQVLKRAAILFALGLFLYGFPHFDPATQRILGVLQRLAICYAAAALLYRFTMVRAQIITIVGLLALYWVLMAFVPVPGYGVGRLDVEGNLAHWVDWTVLGKHNYSGTKTWDPEGIVSTLPAIATTLFGLMAGYILRKDRVVLRLTVIGVLLVAVGQVCDIWLPINKKIWTSSFAMFMAGLDFVIFAACYWLIDEKGLRSWTRPFVILGMNAIAVYMISELLISSMDEIGARDWFYQNVFLPVASPVNASLLFAIAYVLVNYAIAYWLYRKGWFLKV